MKKEILLGVSYVSCLVIIWGSVGSLVDYLLLQLNVYVAGSLGQASTFFVTGILFTLIGIKAFPKIQEKLFKINS